MNNNHALHSSEAQKSGMKSQTLHFTPVILAGGKGTRLKEVIQDYPKVLAKVNGKPFITYLFDILIDFGFPKVVVCTGFRGDVISDFFSDGYRNLQVILSHESAPLGTGGAVRKSVSEVDTENILLFNGDSFVHFDLYEYVAWYEKMNLKLSLLLTELSEVSRYGSVEMSGNGNVTSFTEKGTKKGGGFINAGVYLIKKNLLNIVPAEKEYSLERDFLPQFVGNGLFGFPCIGPFIDIGTPESLAAAESFFNSHHRKISD